ncbi:hypothetical protein K457DRAFT_889106, partial [Linnemannia elongata AG-77]
LHPSLLLTLYPYSVLLFSYSLLILFIIRKIYPILPHSHTQATMRSTFTFLVLILFVSLSIVLSQTSAQTPTPTPTPKPRGNDTISGDFDSMLACMKCLSKAGLSQVPACSNLQDNPAISSVPVDKLDETQRQCYCGLVSSTEWTKSCSSGSTLQQQRCNATIVDTFLQGFAHVRPYVCTVTLSSQKSRAVGGLQAVVVEVSSWMTLAALSVFTVLL